MNESCRFEPEENSEITGCLTCRLNCFRSLSSKLTPFIEIFVSANLIIAHKKQEINGKNKTQY